MTEFLKIATLENGEVDRLRALEKDMGVHIMALEKDLKVAKLSDKQLARVKSLEGELNVTLLVFESE